MEWTHRIYGRKKGTKERWKPLDVGSGQFVGNLIYASCFDEATSKEVLTKLAEHALDYEFEARKI